MEVKTFESLEAMQEHIRERAAAAHEGLADAQRGLDVGDHWVQFADIDNRQIVFGQVHTYEAVAIGELSSGASWEETVAVVGQTAAGLMDGMMYGRAYDRFNVEGELGYTHKAHAWPIEMRLFEAAQSVDWEINDLDPAMKLLLEVAFRSMKAHVLTGKDVAE